MIKDDIKLANFDVNRITDIKQRQKAIKWWSDRLQKKDKRVAFNTNGTFYIKNDTK